jgi:hypothetical protein
VNARAEIDVVGLRPLGAELEVVAASVAGRNAGTLVVERGKGEPVARLLLSGEIVEWARKLMMAMHSPLVTETERAVLMLDAVGRLEKAIAEVDATDVSAASTGNFPVPEPSDPPPVRRMIFNQQPGRIVHETVNTLLFGNPEGNSGDSIFRAVAVAGTVLIARPGGAEPAPFAAFNGARDALPCWEPLAYALEGLADNIRSQHAVAARELAEQKGRADR